MYFDFPPPRWTPRRIILLVLAIAAGLVLGLVFLGLLVLLLVWLVP